MRASILTLPTLLLVAACSSFSNPNLQSPEITRINPKTGEVETTSSAKEIEAGLLKSFPDVPIPATHKIDLEHSVIFTSPSQSIGRFTTVGSGTVANIYAFYMAQMQANGWSLVNSFQSSTSSLYFTKPGKFAAIVLETTGRNSSKATLNVGPE